MTVPPLPNLIVRASPPQTSVRQSVLAAASLALALCGAASAQSVPAAPPLSLLDAIELTYGTGPGRTYLIEQASDLQLWSAVSPEVFGDGEWTSQLLPAPSGSASMFFRLKERLSPVTG